MIPRFCIGIMFQNSADWLRRHLPLLQLHFVDGLVGLDGGSTDDSVQVFQEAGGIVYRRPFDWNFGAQANALIEACEDAGFDNLLRLDTDELMMPADILRCRWAAEGGEKIYSLRRIHYVGDYEHIMDTKWVDPQWRVWPLNRGVHYPDMPVHEVPEGLPRANLYHLRIYHYGYAIDPALWRWKRAAYEAISDGLPPPAREQFADHSPLDYPRVPFPDVYPAALKAVKDLNHASMDRTEPHG